MTAIASKLKRKLVEGATEECCGLITGRGKLVDVPNAHPNPQRGFAIPVDVIDKHISSLKGTWHTHPGQGAAMSHEDYEGFRQWPGLTHFIIGTDGVRAYRADETGIVMEVDPCI